MITLFHPKSIVDTEGWTIVEKDRASINARLKKSASKLEVKVGYDLRKNRVVIDLGKQLEVLKGRLIVGADLRHAIEIGKFSGQFVRVDEPGRAAKFKIELRQGAERTDRDTSDAQLKSLFDGLSRTNFQILGCWVNPGKDRPWVNLVVGPMARASACDNHVYVNFDEIDDELVMIVTS